MAATAAKRGGGYRVGSGRKKLTPGPVGIDGNKLALFVKHFLVNGGNKTQAAISAGYAAKSAGSAGYKLYRAAREQIEAAQEEAAAKLGLNLERTLHEIARLAYADPRKLFDNAGALRPIHELEDDVAATVASVENEERDFGGVVTQVKKIKMWDKNAALEKAMKFHGAYEKDNAQKQPVVLQVSSLDEAL